MRLLFMTIRAALLSSCFPFIILSLYFFFLASHSLSFSLSVYAIDIFEFGVNFKLFSPFFFFSSFYHLWMWASFLIEFRLMSVKLFVSLGLGSGCRLLSSDSDNVNVLISLSYMLSGHAENAFAILIDLFLFYSFDVFLRFTLHFQWKLVRYFLFFYGVVIGMTAIRCETKDKC